MPKKLPDELKSLIAAAEPAGSDNARLVLADWLQDHGDGDTAHALRWMVKHGKQPIRSIVYSTWFWRRKTIDVGQGGGLRIGSQPDWLPKCIGMEMKDRFSASWFHAVKNLGRAMRRVRDMTEL